MLLGVVYISHAHDIVLTDMPENTSRTRAPRWSLGSLAASVTCCVRPQARESSFFHASNRRVRLTQECLAGNTAEEEELEFDCDRRISNWVEDAAKLTQDHFVERDSSTNSIVWRHPSKSGRRQKGEGLQLVLHPVVLDEWEVNPQSPHWSDFKEKYSWAIEEKWSAHTGAPCEAAAAEGSPCPFASLNPVRLMACFDFDERAIRAAADGEYPQEEWLVVPSAKWYHLRDSGMDRPLLIQYQIQLGWHPNIWEMKEAATTDMYIPKIVRRHDKWICPLDEPQWKLMLKQLWMTRRIVQGDDTPPPEDDRLLTFKEALREIFFGYKGPKIGTYRQPEAWTVGL